MKKDVQSLINLYLENKLKLILKGLLTSII